MPKSGKTVVINSILMATPIYYLFVYPIPDSVINKISQITRKFLWANNDNGRGFHLVNWANVTSNKPEKDLGIMNLYAIKHSLMAKNLFNYLNKHNSIWMEILYMKYGDHNLWTQNFLVNCFVFFKGLHTTADLIKANLWIKCVNPSSNSVMFHP